MKKHIKKLNLKKRTVVNLRTAEKQSIKGGTSIPEESWLPGCGKATNTCLCMTFAECESNFAG
jgi:hypothetical protein